MTFFLSELKYSLRRPMVWIFFGLMALLTFGATASDNVMIGGAVGNILKNAPHIITVETAIMSIFGLLIATAFFNNAALKDYSNNFNEILFSTPLSKSGYYFGRFAAALVLSTIPMLGVFFGIILGTLIAPAAGWIDASRIGPLYLETFVNNYFLFILPNMFFAGAIIFAMANKWKSTVISFVGSLIIIIGYMVAGTFMSDIDNETLAGLVDTFGIRAYSVEAKYYTPSQKNTISPGFHGILLWNRLVWIGTGAIILFAAYFNFSFKSKNKKVKKARKETLSSLRTLTAPSVTPTFNRRTEWLQFKSFFHTNLLSILKSVTFKILFLFSAIILISSLAGGFEYFGLKAYPLTYKMVNEIGSAAGIFMIIILVFFSGELIWRDRESKISEVIDSTAHTSFISLAAKALSLVSVTAIIHLFFIFISIIYQLISGYTNIEIGLYFVDFFYNDFPSYFVLSGFLILIQVLINNKYLGYFASILFIFVFDIVLSMLHIESNMLSIAGSPSLQYSDMNGFGPGLKGAMWFNTYWSLFSILCLLIAGMFWNRGLVTSVKDRLKLAKKQVPKSYKSIIVGVFGIWLLVAGFVYYNTQVLNPYHTSKQEEEGRANYEKTYKKFQYANLPKVTNVKYNIDLYPSERNARVNAVIQLTNKTNAAIDSLHFNTSKEWKATFEIPNSELVLDDQNLGYIIYQLNTPLDTGQTMTITINTEYITKGFKNSRGSIGIIKNGSFVNNFTILPTLGYQEGNELSEKTKRKKYGLTPKDRMPKLEANCAHHCDVNYLTEGRSDYINVATTISTDGDQIAIAPGSLIKKWNKDGRNFYQYEVDHPSSNFYSFISARFEVAKRKWKGVDIEVYYDKKHPYNIESMLDAVERSLDYYTKNFGPYYHKQCRIIEFPRYATFAQAFPGTMPYSEAYGFVINLEDSTKNNVIDAVIAHEMGHQWWAHQVVGAKMQGGTMMSESFAEYSSLMVMKHHVNDPMKMRQFLKYDFNRYLRGRSTEIQKELPLYKVENQNYIHYGKGSIIMYALQDFIGEENVNLAMRNFLEEYRYNAPPYPTSLDFLRHLDPQVPDSLKYLIDDWFKEITLYDYRLKDAFAKKLENGRYAVTFNVIGKKIKADSLGNETIVPIDDWVDIGVFADNDEEVLLTQKRVKINQEEMQFTLEMDSIPVKAAIDPRKLMIDKVYKDNIKRVKME